MSIEEDAMLVAIGQMDIAEAREKYSDDWAEFCKKLTRWKSVHQFFRLWKLNGALLQVTKQVKFLENQKAFLKQIVDEFNAFAKEHNLGKNAEEALDAAIKKYTNDVAEPKDKKFPRIVKYSERDLDAAYSASEAYSDFATMKGIRERRVSKAKERMMELQDRYDITKTYAMGLLVADVFYSLSAALEGDIY